MISNFDSMNDYFRFVFAKSFYTSGDRPEEFKYDKNFIENVGSISTHTVSFVADFMLRHIRNPLMIVALTVAAIAVVTIVFYPGTFVAGVATLFPFVLAIQPWMVKLSVFAFVQWNIIGVGLRTIGRLSNSTLMNCWVQKDIQAVSIGVEIVQERIKN